MHYVKVVRPRYEQSRRFRNRVGEVVGHWGPDTSEAGREGFMVEFRGGEVVGLTPEEVDEVPATEAQAAIEAEEAAETEEAVE